ncbi:MFS general substrate transporter [Panus rudis PR-1116 ss-1]|nr:MFS general substrate transporter [Panus rudis PR-1116 ss-1]
MSETSEHPVDRDGVADAENVDYSAEQGTTIDKAGASPSAIAPSVGYDKAAEDRLEDSVGDSKDDPVTVTTTSPTSQSDNAETDVREFRLYKRRFVGAVALFLLSAVSAMPWPWFGPISNTVSGEFGFSLNQVNWFGTVVNLVFLPASVCVPIICSKWGIRRTCDIGGVFMLVSAWVRYAGTASTLTKQGSYALIMVGQILGGIAQPFFLVLGPKYSETWFGLKGRITVTMALSIANPVGGAIAQIVSPAVGTTKESVRALAHVLYIFPFMTFQILVLGIITTAVVPLVLLVGNSPPKPPTLAASQKVPDFSSFVRALRGLEHRSSPTYMTIRERVDFAIIALEFGVLVGVVTSFSVLTSQFLAPYGYSDDISGFMGAVLLLVGIVAALITAPLFDRVLTNHLAITCKILCPILAVLWLSLIWAVKRNNEGGLFAIMALAGATAFPMLPVALELAVELTRNANASSAVLWFAGNAFGVMYILAEGALRAPDTADPPKNMHRALIFQGAFICSMVSFIFLIKGEQRRRKADEEHAKAMKEARERIDLDSRPSQGDPPLSA